jgi:UDP-N-acetylmuramyl pentapeptide phosphotransferase/UDP-N-acetylglucosamine-1-phosphate transferase
MNSSSLLVLIYFISAAGACAALLAVLLRSGMAWTLAVDKPNSRSLHSVPIPRCGGWGVLPVVLVASLSFAPHWVRFDVALAMLALVSWWDDRATLSARVRMAVHLLAAALIFFPPTSIPWPIALIWFFAIAWGTNLYNFMDGSNGLSGSMMVVGFGSYAIAALGNNTELAAVAAAFAGAGLGFLFFNWDPAKIFLGDMGSIPAGFAMGALGFYGWHSLVWPAWFPALVFAPFICDASLTLLRRLFRGERVWQAHREHFYQRLIQSGYTHGQSALLWLGMMIATGGGALLLQHSSGTDLAAGLLLEAILLLVVAIFIEVRWKNYLRLKVQT